ncbi:MAG: hypothetical protein JJ992_06350, partial [Planctomycetes bacterium]|nr:hypothetical protein [Planctomycetota bacterium]
MDVTSQPLERVRVQVDGVHMGQKGVSNAHGAWNTGQYGPAPEDTTDSDGRAYLASPVLVSELMMATGISFTAAKSGYASRRIFSYPVDGTERDEVLMKGNTLIVAAYIGEPSQRVSEFTPELSWSANVKESDWRTLADGSRLTDMVSDGKHVLTAERKTADGAAWHSDAVPVELTGGETKQVEIELKPAMEL